MELEGTHTHDNLKAAFEAESTASMLYRWSAQQADVEGQPEVAKRFMQMAEVKAGQALGYCLLYTSPSPRDQRGSRMPSSA